MTRPSPSPFIIGVLICFLGAVCFSTKAIFVKLAYRDTTVDAVTLLALRMVFSFPFFLVSAYYSSKNEVNQRLSSKVLLLIFFVGCLGYYVSSLLDFLGLQFVSAGIERLILFIYPTLVLLMNATLFREKIKPIQWLAVLVTYAGLLIAFTHEVKSQHFNENFLKGSLLIFVCSFTYAAYIVGSGKLIPIAGAARFNSFSMSAACVGVLVHFFVTTEQSLLHFPIIVYAYSFLMAILGTVIPSYLVTEGMKRVGSDNAAILGSVGPVSTIFLAYLFLNESISLLQLFGTCLILFGVLIISRSKKTLTT